ncbi:MAG: DUF3846 domain-containing protein [Betaproteobacteria bacterium]|nr:DUF3846 domain-containing protein [Betaproteobacteria bacterium]
MPASILTVIAPDGAEHEQTHTTFADLQKLVGGYVEVIKLPAGKVAIINEDGLPLGLAHNAAASARLGYRLVGTVVIGPASILE